MDRAAITTVGGDDWTPIACPHAIWDEEEARWVSDAEVAEVPYAASTSRKKAGHVRGRLIVRRVKRLSPTRVGAGQNYQQGELSPLWRNHVIFTDVDVDVDGDVVEVEAALRDHAVVEQVIAGLKGGPVAHLPSGTFTANAVWLVCVVMCHDLLRVAGHVAGGALMRARAGPLRALSVEVPARWRWSRPWTRFASVAGLNAGDSGLPRRSHGGPLARITMRKGPVDRWSSHARWQNRPRRTR